MKSKIATLLTQHAPENFPDATPEMIELTAGKIASLAAQHGIKHPFEDNQKQVVYLRTIPKKDRGYESAEAEIKTLTSLEGWEEPEKVAAKNITDHTITVNGLKVAKLETVMVYPWELRGLARWLRPGDPSHVRITPAFASK